MDGNKQNFLLLMGGILILFMAFSATTVSAALSDLTTGIPACDTLSTPSDMKLSFKVGQWDDGFGFFGTENKVDLSVSLPPLHIHPGAISTDYLARVQMDFPGVDYTKEGVVFYLVDMDLGGAQDPLPITADGWSSGPGNPYPELPGTTNQVMVWHHYKFPPVKAGKYKILAHVAYNNSGAHETCYACRYGWVAYN
jgi:hypothetical protein